MRKIREVIVVEGRYDKNTLSQVVDATILETGGFGIFKDKEKAALLRRLGAERGIIVFTDSDGAGFVIRNHLKSILPTGQLKQAYIPDVPGKERRKRTPGKEGKLGVEGMPPQVLLAALERCGATFLGEEEKERQGGSITKADLMELGRTIYDRYKAGEEVEESAKALCDAIRNREESIGEYEKKIAEIKGASECPKCGKMVAKEMAYCPYCGEKIDRTAKAEDDDLTEEAADAAAEEAESEAAEEAGEGVKE